MQTTVSSKGQVTIPKKLRDRLGITVGTVLAFAEENGRLVAVKTDPADRVSQVYGVLRDGRGSDEVLAALRGDPDEP